MGEKRTAISKIRRLAVEYSAGDLSDCLASQLQTGENACSRDSEDTQLLAQAAFVRDYADREGVTLREALRELGARMRRLAG